MTTRISLTQQVHQQIHSSIPAGSLVIDATCGNGYDTVMLAHLVGDGGHVFGFDIQSQALDNTRSALESNQLQQRVTLFQTPHQLMWHTIPPHYRGEIALVAFNLGYLPGGDKQRTTQGHTTLEALQQAVQLLAPTGAISILAYPGHPSGAAETQLISDWCRHQQQQGTHITHTIPPINRRPPPEWFWLESPCPISSINVP